MHNLVFVTSVAAADKRRRADEFVPQNRNIGRRTTLLRKNAYDVVSVADKTFRSKI